jgi:hypothetical protein
MTRISSGCNLTLERIEMSASRLTELLLGALLMIATTAIPANAADSRLIVASADKRVSAIAAPSGIYGFSGARAGDNDPQGVIGECIWIFDRLNKAQIARGDCSAGAPGQFRVALHPGKYIVRGPGGNRAIEVKAGQWVKIVSIAAMPLSF